MKQILLLVAAVILTAVTTLILSSELSSNESQSEGVVRAEIQSQILNQSRDIIIHLPRTFDPTKKYPVIYILDGSSQDSHIANTVDVLTSAGYLSETIVVGIPNMTAENREANLTPPFMRRNNDDENSLPGNADPFLDFIEKELIPYMEREYSASGVRVFCGHSRGGLTVMYSLVHKPKLFQGRICFSAPLWRQDNILVTKVSEFLNSKDSLNTFLYLSAGKDETDNIRNGLEKMVTDLRGKALPGLVFHSDIIKKANHQSNPIFSAPKAIARWSDYCREHPLELN